MKKLLIVLLICFGCDGEYYPAKFGDGQIIHKVIKMSYPNGQYCFYYSTGWTGSTYNGESKFIDLCGKWTVGDTLYLTKKSKRYEQRN